MEAVEFKSKIKNNKILVPKNMQSKLEQDKNVRVIVLIEELSEDKDNLLFQQMAKEQFLDGYADSDSIYDEY